MQEKIIRNKRKVQIGVVDKISGQKTVKVRLDIVEQEKKFKKVVKVMKNILVHDEKSECKIGDIVEMMETRPLSGSKKWRIVKIVGQKEINNSEELENDTARV